MIQSVYNKSLKVPVLFIIFNRPVTPKVVFEAIRHNLPIRLSIAADGSRKDRADDKNRCAEARKIGSVINWKCTVLSLFRPKILGCGRGVCEAINWFFESEEEGIILEGDCLPAPSFFSFAKHCYNITEMTRA